MDELFSTYNTVKPFASTVQNTIPTPPQTKLDRFYSLLRTSKQQTPTDDQNWFSNTTVSTTPSTTTTSPTTNSVNYKSWDLATAIKNSGLDKYIRITSGFRDHNVGKAGSKSNHRRKNEFGHSMAYDIAPVNGQTFESMYQAIKGNETFQSWLKGNGFNINDETTAEALAKTGGTGKHYHIGPDAFNIVKGAHGIDTSIFSQYESAGQPQSTVKRKLSAAQLEPEEVNFVGKPTETKEKPDDQTWFTKTDIKTDAKPVTTTSTTSTTPARTNIPANERTAQFDADFAKYGTSDIFKNHANFWRQLAFKESSFTSNIRNKIGAYGYFQLMPASSTGADVATQFKDAEKLMTQHMKTLNDEDRRLAKEQGISEEGLMAGVWIGGPGGVKKALRRQGNAADANGTTVLGRMKQFSS